MDKVIYGPNIYTMGPDNRVVEAVGIEDGKVEVLGSKKEVLAKSGPETEEINPTSSSMFPGFIDAHLHFLDLGLYELFYLDLSSATSKEELLEKIEEEANKRESSRWILGCGWDESVWTDEQEIPTKGELDSVVPDKPVAIQRVDMHTFSVNSLGIEQLDVDPATKGARRKNGEFIGIFSEDASIRVKQAITLNEEDRVKALGESIKDAHCKGVTSVNQMVVDPGEFGRYIGAYQKLNGEGNLGVRTVIYFTENYLDRVVNLGLKTGFGDERLKIGGLKLFADGSIGSKTAWVKEPFQGEPNNKGMSIWDSDELGKLMRKADSNGIQLAIHTIGDRAIGQVVGLFEEIIDSRGESSVRHRIEHCEMGRDDQIEKMSELGLIASTQPNYIGKWGLPGSMYENRFSRERLAELNRFRTFKDKGVHLAFGSDGMPFDPLYGIHWAVNTPFDSQKLSPESAIRAYTRDAAFVGGLEKHVGSIEPGKYADFVLLDDDPIEEPKKIKDMDVEMTFMEGKLVYSSS